MRDLFQHQAQRDPLRPELNKKSNKNNNTDAKTPRRRPGFNHLVSAFLLAALANEASHHHHPQNPHGNRRERIEEIRMRLSEAELNSRGQRSLNAGAGGGTPEPRPAIQTAVEAARRRSPGIDAQS
ncbi:MAG: hypothetical protein Q8K65_00665 [Alphaproteobacteria bacterium]|nr:hypothetical protein [Alphaproteobacteria bacterium]